MVRKMSIEKLNKTVKLKNKYICRLKSWKGLQASSVLDSSPFLNVKVKVSEVKRFAWGMLTERTVSLPLLRMSSLS